MLVSRCYWWPVKEPADGKEYEDGGKFEMGLNTNNINPELLRFVDRKFEYSVLQSPLKKKDAAHPDDPAKY